MRKADDLSPFELKFQSFPHALSELARQVPDRIAFRFLEQDGEDDSALTFGQLDRRAREVASRLLAEGLSGERALLLYPPGLDFVIGLFGAIYAGVVAVPVYLPRKNRTADRVRSIAEDAQAAAVLTHSDALARLDWFVDQAQHLGAIPWFATDQFEEAAGESEGLNLKPRHDALALLQYTSGSTGTPRGVMLTHGNLTHNCRVIQRAFSGRPEDVIASWLPTYHDMGLVGGILTPVATASTAVLMSPMAFLQHPVRWLRMITRFGISISGAPNFAYELCTRKVTDEELEGLDLRSWQLAFNGAEPIRAATMRDFARRFSAVGFRETAFYTCFGMAEATLMVTGTYRGAAVPILKLDRDRLERHDEARPSGDEQEKTVEVVSSGHVQDAEGDVRIVDHRLGVECAPGKIGEIWVSSPSVGLGYWNRPAESEATFRAVLDSRPAARYLRTGDLGFIDRGELYVVGRIKDMIIVRGVNHYPQDIELTAERSDPRVRAGAVAAFGVTRDNKERLVVVAEVRRTSEDSTEELGELITTIRSAVARVHDLAPETVVLIRNGSIPKTSSGKIRRNDCREAYMRGELLEIQRGVSSVPHTAHVASRVSPPEGALTAVFAAVRSVAGERAAQLNSETNLLTLGLDSLERLEIANRLEQRFGGTFPEEVLASMETCGEVADAVHQFLVGRQATPATDRPIPEAHYRVSKFPEYEQLQRTIGGLTTGGAANPYFRTHAGIGRDTVVVKGRPCINFSSYNYLGLSGHPHVTQAARQAIDWYGTSVSASRLVSGQRELHTELEHRLANFLGAEDAVVMVSGHATNVTTIGHLLGREDLVLYDALAHNSILEGAKLSGAHKRAFPHNDWRALDRILTSTRRQYRRVLIAIEGTYSMDGDFPELPRFVDIREAHKCLLLVDEAHSIGTMGPTGRGIGEHFGVPASSVDLWMGTLSKALGSCGGYVAGSADLIRYLRYTAPGFVYSVGMTPANAAAALAALDVVIHHPSVVQRCRERSQLLLEMARDAGLDTGGSHGTPIVPIIVGNSRRALEISLSLLDRGINVHPILHPAVEERGARLRFFVTSEHTPDQIAETIEALAEEFPRQEGRPRRQMIVTGTGERFSVDVPVPPGLQGGDRPRRQAL